MIGAQRLTGMFRDSPTYGRDWASLVSGLAIGTIALLLNAAIMTLVLPLMMDPNDHDVRSITQHVEFGQLLSLIILGGAATLATFVIPLRLVTVFWGPRLGRYFDQIVLSGITPFRFVIGKVTSQNLFLVLIVFLLLPYLVLSITLGGIDFGTFAAGLFLVWLYCMALAVVTLWASLYLNDLLAALAVIAGAVFLAGLGFIPIQELPVAVTPFPALVHPLYTSLPFMDEYVTASYAWVFCCCVLGMTSVILLSLAGLHYGPLYGVVRDNSTFGEVVRAGDSKKKRWLRFRHHIQRPSELTFFYENRSDAGRSAEGLFRWGRGFAMFLLPLTIARWLFLSTAISAQANTTRVATSWWVFDFHVINLIIHGFAIVAAVVLFAHAKNSVCLKLPVLRGRKLEVATLDTIAFLLCLALTCGLTIATPLLFEEFVAKPAGFTVFPTENIDYSSVSTKECWVLALSGLVLYGIHRIVCMCCWLRSVAAVISGCAYFLLVCLAPMLLIALYFEFPLWRDFLGFRHWGPQLAAISPMTTTMVVFEEAQRDFPALTTAPFCVFHLLLLIVILFAYRRADRSVRQSCLATSVSETG